MSCLVEAYAFQITIQMSDSTSNEILMEAARVYFLAVDLKGLRGSLYCFGTLPRCRLSNCSRSMLCPIILLYRTSTLFKTFLRTSQI